MKNYLPSISRRHFINDLLLKSAVVAASGSVSAQGTMETTARAASPNETIAHAVIGCRIRGRVHAQEFAKIPGVAVTHICDPDRKLAEELAVQVEKQTGKRPEISTDLRTIFDNPAIDTVSIATPNHWHALASIWAMQAGKDVYVEKPVSNTIEEGRRMVACATATQRICQSGTQNRSVGAHAAIAEFIKSGKLGKVELARTIIYGQRGSIGKRGLYMPPPEVDFNLWLGPATEEKLTRPQLHYDWHWVWDTGNGELGNNNIHYIDLVRWMIGLQGKGDSVLSVGGRLGYEDAGDTPNTQLTFHGFQDLTIIQEVRGLKSEPFSKTLTGGWIIYGTEGIIAGTSLFDTAGNLKQSFSGNNENHFANFIDAVRSRKRSDLNADISEGHQSTALCHLGNISHRLGIPAKVEEIREHLTNKAYPDEVVATFGRLLDHLSQHQIDLAKTPLTLGKYLTIAADDAGFEDKSANVLLTREYRPEFTLPEIS